jgi:hypothetical protein
MTRLYPATVLALFHGVVLFGALNLLGWCYLKAFPVDPIALTYGRRPFAIVYPGRSAEEVRQILNETWNRPAAWEPFTESRERRFQGRFVNVHPAGFRLSHSQGPWPPDRARANVFVFGGSTTFGYGVADDETIVSALQDYLDRRSGPAHVSCYNFGRGAYYSTGERVFFQELLTAGSVPRVAVFIDGLNEFAFAAPFLSGRLRKTVRSPVIGALDLLAEELPLAQVAARWKARKPRRRSEAQLRATFDDPGLLDGRIERYLANRRLIEAAAAAWGVRPLFVWQPVPTYRYDLRYHLLGDFDFEQNNYSTFGYRRMAERLRREPPVPDFLWAADLQVGVFQPLYVDQVHYTAAMSERIGVEIGRALLDRALLR